MKIESRREFDLLQIRHLFSVYDTANGAAYTIKPDFYNDELNFYNETWILPQKWDVTPNYLWNYFYFILERVWFL